MLTISKPLSSSQAQTYHAKEFMSAEQNYWKQGDTILGEWQGRMAERYGLAGAIDELHFARLSEGQNPLTGEQLVRHRNGQEYTTADGTTVKPVEHRAGWDATFSAPKSVSLTALVIVFASMGAAVGFIRLFLDRLFSATPFHSATETRSASQSPAY
jgi:conjugative relaxase-like TrwC/TraI family protein